MVTHITPPSPSLSATSLAYRPRSSSVSSTARSTESTRQKNPTDRHLPQGPPRSSAFPPSPPSSYTSPPSSYAPPPSSYTATPSNYYGRSSYTPTRAPSVASYATTSAARPSHRRSNHSAHGSHRHSRRSSDTVLAAEEQNVFPCFSQSGDAEVILRDRTGRKREKRYILHALILAQNSDYLRQQLGDAVDSSGHSRQNRSNGGAYDDIMSSQFQSRSSSPSRPAKRARWRFELDWSGTEPNAGPSSSSMPLLVRTRSPDRQALPLNGRPRICGPSDSSSSHRSASRSRSSTTSSHSQEVDILEAYDNMFMIFYNHSPRLDTQNIATAYVQSKLLLSLAQTYGALPPVRPRIEHHMLSFHRELYLQIAKYPPSYLKLGHLAQSKAIFGEALVHVVGLWPTASGQLRRGQVDNAVLDLIEDKVEELEEMKARIEVRLLRAGLGTSRGERVGPANAWLDWLAVSLFRQWIADNTVPAQHGILKDSPSSRETPPTGRVYRLLAVGGEAYLDHDSLKRFLKKDAAQYSRDNLRKFERRMNELKHQASDMVRPLTRNFLQMDASKHSEMPAYLTCTRVEERDFDWVWSN